MKTCLSYKKAASSALIFATLGCLAVTLSPAKAASETNTKSAASVETTNQELPASTALLEVTEKAEVGQTTNLLTVAQPTKPITESALPIPSGEISLKEPQPKTTEILGLGTGQKTAEEELQREPVESLSSISKNPNPATSSVVGVDSQAPISPSLDLTAQEKPNNPDADNQLSPGAIPLPESEAAAEDDPMGVVTNVTQLSDVKPSDWAYEALSSLVQRYGCIAGYPDRTFRGNRAMSRYEFAAGLNACLQQIERLITTRTSDFANRKDLETLQRLVNDFRPELARLGSRLDKLEGRTALLEDRQFSTTTKLFGQAIFGLQGRSENKFDFFLDRLSDQGTKINLVDNVQLSLFTQFSPRTLLLTGLAAGNGSNNTLRLDKYVSLAYEGGANNSLEISDLNVRHLFGSKFALIAGPVGVNPVNVFRGANRVESAGSGPLSRFAQRNPIVNIGGNGGGIGFDWQLATRFSLQGVYSANRSADPANGGIFGGNQGTTTAGVQLVVSPIDQLDISLQYINSYSPSGELLTGVGDDLLAVQDFSSGFARAPISTNAFGAALEWRVTSGVSLGGWGGYTTSNFKGGSGKVETFNWMAFLNFPDLLGQGNLAGIYFGQPPRITSSNISDTNGGRNLPSFINRGDITFGSGAQPGTTYHLEGFYRFRVTDNINITPGVIVIFNPNHNERNDTVTIGALRTTFTF
ncbi:MAG: iron uptake porin [Potamolinea sp.]